MIPRRWSRTSRAGTDFVQRAPADLTTSDAPDYIGLIVVFEKRPVFVNLIDVVPHISITQPRATEE